MCAGCQKPGISRGIWFFMSKLYILLCHFNATKAHRMLKRDGERGKGRVKERTSAATCKLNSHPTWPLHPPRVLHLMSGHKSATVWSQDNRDSVV